MAIPTQDVYSILSSRRQKFAEHLRTKGLEPDEATLLRHSAFLLDNIQLGLNAEDAPAPDIDEGACSATFTITTYNPDRYGDVILPKGCIPHLSKGYRKNPRVFFAHKQNELPIGSCRTPMGELALQFFDDNIKGTCFFHCQTRESEVVFRLVARKELQASSIGFLPVKASLFEPEKTKNRPETDDFGDDIYYFKEDPLFKPLRFLEWDMIEWSVVPIPANAECLAEHLSRGTVEGERITPVLRKAMEPFAAPKKTQLGFVPPTPSVVEDAVKEMAEEEQKLLEKQKEVDEENRKLSWSTKYDQVKALLDDMIKEKEGFGWYLNFLPLAPHEDKSLDDPKVYFEESALLLNGYVKYAKDDKFYWARGEDFIKEFSGEDLIGPPGTPKQEQEDPQKGWPLGAKFLAKTMASYEDMAKWIKEFDSELDQPRVKRLAQKKLNKLSKLSLAALKLGADLYPDKFSYEPSPEEKSLDEARQKVKTSSEEALVRELTDLKNKLAELEQKTQTDAAVEKTLLTLVENQRRVQNLIFEFTGRK